MRGKIELSGFSDKEVTQNDANARGKWIEGINYLRGWSPYDEPQINRHSNVKCSDGIIYNLMDKAFALFANFRIRGMEDV